MTDLTVEAHLGGVVVDLTSRLRDAPATIRCGTPDGAVSAAAGYGRVALQDDDGDLMPLWPLSPYYPHVRRGVLMQLAVRRAVDDFARTVSPGWGSTAAGLAWTTTGGDAADWTVSGGRGLVDVDTADSDRIATLPVSLLDVTALATVRPGAAAGSPVRAGVVLRYVDANNMIVAGVEVTSAGNAAVVVAHRVGGTLTTLATTTIATGTHAGTTDWRLRAEVTPDGTTRARAWLAADPEPTGWQTTAVADIATAGAVGLLARAGSGSAPATVQFDDVDVRVPRMTGRTASYRPALTQLTDGTTATMMHIELGGPLRRLGQGATPLRSTPARWIPTTTPVAYWPLEGGLLADAGPPLVGSAPVRAWSGTHPSGAVVSWPEWGQGQLAPWLPATLSRSGSGDLTVVYGTVVMAATSSWTVDVMYASGTDAGASAIDINPSYLGGSAGWQQVQIGPSFSGVDVAMNGEGEVTAEYPPLFDGRSHHIRWTAEQDGAKVSWTVWVDGVSVNTGTTSGDMTLPAITTVALAAEAQAGARLTQGHLAVWSGAGPDLDTAVLAARGYTGETAVARIARLGVEEGVTIQTLGDADESPAMGPQPVGTLEALVGECVTVDQGRLAELAGDDGLVYYSLRSLYNQPSLDVDLAAYRTVEGMQRQVLTPAYDDQSLRNDWTGRRVGGALDVTVTDSASVTADGRYDDQVELNIASDGQLPTLLSWRLAVGAWDEMRNPALPVDVGNNPALLDGWLSTRVGGRVRRLNPPAPHPPEAIDQLLTGWTETISPVGHRVAAVGVPAGPFTVGVLGTTTRPATAGSVTTASFQAGTDTSLSVERSAGTRQLWTVRPADFPLDLMVSGVRLTATACSGTSDPQTFTVTATPVNGVEKTIPAGTPVRLAEPWRLAR